MITKFSTSRLTYNQRYRALMAGLRAALPAFIIRMVNGRTYGTIGGGYIDASGNAYVCVSNSNGGSDGGQITQKIAPDNSVLWSYSYSNSYGGDNGLHQDSAGNIYTGGFHGNYPGDYYMYSVKYAPDGTRVWQRWFGGAQTYPDNIATNDSGYSAMSGGAFTGGRFLLLDTSGNTVFTRGGNLGNETGEGGYTAGIGPDKVFFGHRRRFNIFDLAGNFKFGRSVSNFMNGGAVRGLSDYEGNVYIWSTNDSTTAYLTKFSATGTQLWDRQLTAPSGVTWASGQGAVDTSNNIYMPFGWTVTSGNGGTNRIFWISFDKNGNVRYQRSADVANVQDVATGINVDSATGRGFVSSNLNSLNGGLISFDLATGNEFSKSVYFSSGAVTVVMDAATWSITTPATLSYATIGDIGGSTSISPVDRGGVGGSTSYTITRGTFA